ncbi:hypothetical protein LCGC14_0642000 [marine sediment metagenome]|uniref:Uncharacterized protein n=1 Tax=marine sediment metagenome TaxID=412755 RepID=A0A0F9U777_9ZZZZ
MTKIPTNVPIISILDGQQVKLDDTPATLNDVIMRALLNIIQGEKLSGEDSFKRYQIATKFADKPMSVDLTSEEIVFIKKAIGDTFGPAVVGPAWDFLEGGKEDKLKKGNKKSDSEEPSELKE